MELFCRFGGMDGTRTRDLLRDRHSNQLNYHTVCVPCNRVSQLQCKCKLFFLFSKILSKISQTFSACGLRFFRALKNREVDTSVTTFLFKSG